MYSFCVEQLKPSAEDASARARVFLGKLNSISFPVAFFIRDFLFSPCTTPSRNADFMKSRTYAVTLQILVILTDLSTEL